MIRRKGSDVRSHGVCGSARWIAVTQHAPGGQISPDTRDWSGLFCKGKDKVSARSTRASEEQSSIVRPNKHGSNWAALKRLSLSSSAVMPRRIVYGISLWVFLGAAACSIASIALPNWVSYTAPTDNDPIRVSYGLHKRCSSITGVCTPFPQPEDCHDENRYFCSIWRSAGFFMNFSLVLELACVIAYITVFSGGRSSREAGWKVLSGLLAIVAAAQLIAMVMVAYLYENDSRFFIGWVLDKSWILCTVSWAVLLIDGLGLVAAAFFLPREDDYEPIPEPL